MDNTTILYGAIQRIYRSSVVGLIRNTLETPGSGGIELVRVLFSKSNPNSGRTYWEDIRVAAEERRSGGTGELSTPISDEYELVGVEHFYSIFEKHFDVLCKDHAAKSRSEKSQSKQALLRWVKQVKNVRDPISHPVTEDISYDDAYNTIYVAKKVLDFCGLAESAAQIQRYQKILLGGLTFEKEQTLTDLPPRDEVVMDFVGRHSELSVLNQWLISQRSRRWALSGEGGKGKSAIAYAFASNVSKRNDHHLDGVFWMSAKRRRYVEGKTVLVDRPDFWDKCSAISAILGFFGESCLDEDSDESKVITLLNEFPSLLVVDDIDTVEGEGEDAIQFLVMTIPELTKSCVLITSRRAMFGVANVTTQVAGLSEMDAEEFIRSRCDLMGIAANPVLELKTKIVDSTDGSPLYIEDLLRLTQTGLEIERALGLWKEKRGLEARKYAIQREFDQLDEDARFVLLALSVNGPCNYSVLAAGLDWGDDRLVSALQQLRNMFLMPATGKDGSTLALGQNTQALVREVYSGSEAYRRVERNVKSIAGKLKTSVSENRLVENILRQTRFLSHKHDYDEAESILLESITNFPGRSDIHANLAWTQRRKKDFASARMNFQRAHDLGNCNADAYWHWSEMEALNNEWGASATAAEQGLKRFPHDQGLLFRHGYALHRLGKELLTEDDEDSGRKLALRADRQLRQALKGGDDIDRNYTLTNQIYRALVLNHESLNDIASLAVTFNEWSRAYPEDEVCRSEMKRIRQKYPNFPSIT
jgi:tetratricopeptide (TPR) repeat protein